MAVEGHASQRPKNDPSVVLPAAVRRAAARSDELITGKAAGELPPATPPVTVVTKYDPKNPNPPEPVIVQPVTSTGNNPSVQVPPQQVEEPDYKHMFESQKGRSERDAQEKADLLRRLAETQRLLGSLNTMPAPPQNNGGSNGGNDVRFGTPGQRKVTDKELAEYGPELVDLIGRRAEEIYAPAMAHLQNELAQLKGQLGGVRNVVAQDQTTRLYGELDQQIPNWQQINTDQNFLAWLSYPDELSGVPRGDLLATAFKQGQTARVAAAFRGFLAYQASFGPAGGNGQVSGNGAVTLASNPASTPGLDLASLAAPGRAKSGQAPATPEKPEITRAEIAEFYRDVSLGRFKGDQALAERQIQDAMREGRIR